MFSDVISRIGSEALVVFYVFFKEIVTKRRGAYNCQMLDFFFSASAGFSLDALGRRQDHIAGVIIFSCHMCAFS